MLASLADLPDGEDAKSKQRGRGQGGEGYGPGGGGGRRTGWGRMVEDLHSPTETTSFPAAARRSQYVGLNHHFHQIFMIIFSEYFSTTVIFYSHFHIGPFFFFKTILPIFLLSAFFTGSFFFSLFFLYLLFFHILIAVFIP
jgi:hypothetical protein